jgi:hypothetical protein
LQLLELNVAIFSINVAANDICVNTGIMEDYWRKMVEN